MQSPEDIFKEFGSLNDDSVMLAFRGTISADLLDSLLHIAELRLKQMPFETRTRKKAFHILVECLQNLFKHSNENEEHLALDAKGMVIMLANEEGIKIATGNTLTEASAKRLEMRLNSLEHLNSESIRAEYKEQLVNGKMSSRGGAGLGFLDIARKSGSGFDYKISPLGDGKFFFTFNVNVA